MMEHNFTGPTLWASKGHILAGLICGAILATVLILTMPKEYRAEMIIGPVQKSGGGSQLSSLLPGANLSALQIFTKQIAQLSSAEFLTFENMMLTRPVIQIAAQDSDLIAPLMLDQRDVRSIRDHLQREIKIYPVGSTPLRRILFHHRDPAYAEELLKDLYFITDRLIKEEAKMRSRAMISYLDEALKEARNPDHREALTALLKEQQHALLMAATDLPYAAQMIEPPIAGAKPVRPDPYLLYPALILFGGFLGYLLAFIKSRNV